MHLAAPGEKEGATQPIDQNYTEDNFRQLGVTIEATATFLDGFGDLAMGCAVVEFPHGVAGRRRHFQPRDAVRDLFLKVIL